MESVIGKLMKTSINSHDELSAQIASQILKNYQKNTWPSQKELSNSLYISELVITKFAQKLGYSGFRELVTLLKFEYHKYESSRRENVNDSKIIHDMLEISLNDLNYNIDFATKFHDMFLDKKQLIIITSPQSDILQNFARDYLTDKGINVISLFPNIHSTTIIQGAISKNVPILFIYTGSDNYLSYKILETIDDKRNDIFAITTLGQTDNVNVKNKYVLKSSLKYNNPFTRLVLFELILLEIFE